MTRLMLFFVLALAALAAQGEEKSTVVIHGFDKMSCADWLASADDQQARLQYVVWTRGVVTGYNFANSDNQVALGRMLGDFSLAMYIDSYCRAHSSVSFAGAVFALIAEKRGNSAVNEIAPISNPSPAPNTTRAPASKESDPFKKWLEQQSDNIRSLDLTIQQDIYKKETSLDAK